MAHWFHRNPLKATGKVSFDLGLVCTNTAARQLCNDLASKRAKLLDILSDPNLEITTVTEAANQYFSYLLGFINAPEEGSSESKIRHAIKFRWTNSLALKGDQPLEQSDCVFELANMLINIGLWYTKHSAKLSAKEDVNLEEAKSIHKGLRTAAGIFQEVKENLIARLIVKGPKASDLDERVLETYVHQCTAEAQEVTMARAVELNHSPSIISSLAYETAKLYQAADLAIATLEDRIVMKWRKYMQFKQACYKAYAYSYHGETLLKEDKCGEAIASLHEGIKHYNNAEQLAKDYGKAPGAGLSARPGDHLFFRRLRPQLERTLEKCNRENGLIYHQKIPSEIPELELKATYGLVAPEKYPMPEICPLWKEGYKAFDVSRLATGHISDKKDDKKDKEEGPIPPVKEQPIYQTDKDPNTGSGCTVS